MKTTVEVVMWTESSWSTIPDEESAMTTPTETESQNAVTMERNLNLAGAFTCTVLAAPSVMDNIPPAQRSSACRRTTRRSSKRTLGWESPPFVMEEALFGFWFTGEVLAAHFVPRPGAAPVGEFLASFAEVRTWCDPRCNRPACPPAWPIRRWPLTGRCRC
jgi:hypothetical protein